jgi:hypothetical protein
MAPARPVGARSGLGRRNSRPWTRRRGLHGRGSLSEGWPRLALCRNLPGTARMVIPARFCGTAWLPPPPCREYTTQPWLFRPRGPMSSTRARRSARQLAVIDPDGVLPLREFAFGTAPHRDRGIRARADASPRRTRGRRRGGTRWRRGPQRSSPTQSEPTAASSACSSRSPEDRLVAQALVGRAGSRCGAWSSRPPVPARLARRGGPSTTASGWSHLGIGSRATSGPVEGHLFRATP